MKKITIFCMLFASLLLIAGCKNALTKADVEKMISEHNSGNSGGGGNSGGTGEQPSGKASISEIFETALLEVTGKTWKSDRNTGDAGDIGGRKDAGFDHEITFDKESFTFSISMKDRGINGKDEMVNKDYMNYVKTGLAEMTNDGKLVFKNRMFIKRIYLPKLSKWLAYDGEDENSNQSESPFNEYFKEGLKEGYPNILLDVELEVKETGVGRFRNVDHLAMPQKLRLVIKNGELHLKDVKEDVEDSSDLEKNYLDSLFENYYGNTGATFKCDAWNNAKQDEGLYAPDVSTFQTEFDNLKTDMEDTTKRKSAKVLKWGLVGAAIINDVFDKTKILGVKKEEIDNPTFDPDQPESPSNPKKKYAPKALPALYTLDWPEPANKKVAHHDWKSHDGLNTTILTHQVNSNNRYGVKDFDTIKNTEVVWEILYGINDHATPATLKVKRSIQAEAFDTSDTSMQVFYRSNEREHSDSNTFDHDDPSHWKNKKHEGKAKKYKLSYTVTLTFDDLSATALKKAFPNKVLTSNEFIIQYEALDGTADNDFDWVYFIDPYNVMERREKDEKWLEFAEIELYGIVAKKKADGSVDVENGGNEMKLTAPHVLKRLITKDTVLNAQTHFFVPSVLGNDRYIQKITKVKVCASMANVKFTLVPTDFTFSTSPLVWIARGNVDTNDVVDYSKPDGSQEFEVTAGNLDTTAGGLDSLQGKKLIIKLDGEAPAGLHPGEDKTPANKKTIWQGYSFVIHFGR